MTAQLSDGIANEGELRAPGQLAELLAASDVVSLHVPLTPETKNLIDADTLALMRPGASLVNCGRGGLVGSLFGAASLYLLGTLLVTLQVNPSLLQVMYGGMLVVAVCLAGLGGRLRTAR